MAGIEKDEAEYINVDQVRDFCTEHDTMNDDDNRENTIIYKVEEKPPTLLSMLLGFQHFLTFFGGGISISLVLASLLCMNQDPVAVSQLISTSFFVEGVATFIQTTFGLRLPIVQGSSAAFLVPIISLMKSKGQCPIFLTDNSTANEHANYTEEWQTRIREIQGSIMLASCLQVVIGFTGVVGVLLRYIGPVTVAPVVVLVAIGIVPPAANNAGQHWGIAALTIVLILLFSLYLRKVEVPLPTCSVGPRFRKLPIFQMFPIAPSILLAWLVAYICTVNDVFPDDSPAYGYRARTDIQPLAVSQVSWVRIPYPGQWGLPGVSVAGVIGLSSAIIASIIESLGDYYAAARMTGVPPPPPHAVNRAVFMEGIGCLLAGAWGTANGTTSFSSNIGLIGVTKVGSRFVIQMCALFMIVIGMLEKVNAVLSSIPIPIVGGVLCVMLSMVMAVGLSNLQFVDLNSPRNLLIIGFALFMGITVPYWMEENADYLHTGIDTLDQVISVMLTTGMLIGGVLAIILDNTVPGTAKERGILAFAQEYEASDEMVQNHGLQDVYNLPFGMTWAEKYQWLQCFPMSSAFSRPSLSK